MKSEFFASNNAWNLEVLTKRLIHHLTFHFLLFTLLNHKLLDLKNEHKIIRHHSKFK